MALPWVKTHPPYVSTTPVVVAIAHERVPVPRASSSPGRFDRCDKSRFSPELREEFQNRRDLPGFIQKNEESRGGGVLIFASGYQNFPDDT